MRFPLFSTVHANTISFILIHFHRCFQIENTQCISVDGRGSKRIEMYAILNKNELVWTGP